MNRFAKKTLLPLSILLGLGAASALAHLPAGDDIGCLAASWTPEVYVFYGDGRAVLEKTTKVNIAQRRVFACVVETAGKTEVFRFEKQAGGYSAVRGGGVPGEDFNRRIQATILENHGKQCVGAITKPLFEKLQDAQRSVTAPFQSLDTVLREALAGQNGYLRVTIYLLC